MTKAENRGRKPKVAPSEGELMMADANYNPDNLLNALKERLLLKNDAALSRALEVAPPVISKIRHRRLPVTAWFMVKVHDRFEIPMNSIRELMGVAPVPSSIVRQQ